MNLRILPLVLLLPWSALPAQDGPGGQTSGTSGPTGMATLVGVESPIISEQYVLMPGDRLLATVAGGITYSYETYVTYEGKVTIVTPVGRDSDGNIKTDVVDAVRVSGFTLQQAQDTLSSVMRRYFRSVNVSLTLIGLRSGIVFVTGEVQYPGAYNASPVERVSQVIAKAGGLAPLGSRTKVNLVRGGRLQSIADIERFESRGDLMANPFVESGDVIYVPAVEGLVTVKGAVFGRGQYQLRSSALTTEKERISEGIYELKPGERVLDMIRKAGGITPWADLTNCYIERLVVNGGGKRKRLPVDLQAVLLGQSLEQDIELANSDVLVVPPINTLVYVTGEVTSPGPLLYTPNLRASDYVGQAGGPTNYANIRSGYIQRGTARISTTSDPVVEPGDKIYLPRVTLRFWQDYLQIVSAIGIPVASIVISLAALQR